MVIRLLVVCLVLLAAVVFLFLCGMLMYELEKKKEEKSKEEAEESYQVAISMCLKTRHAGSCPGVCKKCAWGVMQDKIVEFREKK